MNIRDYRRCCLETYERLVNKHGDINFFECPFCRSSYILKKNDRVLLEGMLIYKRNTTKETYKPVKPQRVS